MKSLKKTSFKIKLRLSLQPINKMFKFRKKFGQLGCSQTIRLQIKRIQFKNLKINLLKKEAQNAEGTNEDQSPHRQKNNTQTTIHQLPLKTKSKTTKRSKLAQVESQRSLQ